MTVHVRYISSYISLPSSAQLHREITKFCVFWRTRTTAGNFSYFHLKLNAGVTYLASASSETSRHTEQI